MRRAVMAASGGVLLALVVTLAAGRVPVGANEPAASAALVQAWGGPGAGHPWLDSEHGIHVDDRDHVWLAGNGARDGIILNFTRDGEFVMKRPS